MDGLSLALHTAVHNFLTVKALYYNRSGFSPIQGLLFERSGVVGQDGHEVSTVSFDILEIGQFQV